MTLAPLHTLLLGSTSIGPPQTVARAWTQFGGDAVHSNAVNGNACKLQRIRWSARVDENYTQITHYGSPLITLKNTVIYPVKTGASNNFRIEARNGATGKLIYTVPTDYTTYNPGWISLCGPALTSDNRLIIPGAGGTVYIKANADLASSPVTQVAFVGMANYLANKVAYDGSVKIVSSIATDKIGNAYFNYRTFGTPPAGLKAGIVKLQPNGTTIMRDWFQILGGTEPWSPMVNAAPAIDQNGFLYFGMNVAGGSALVKLNSNTMNFVASVQPKSLLQTNASFHTFGTAAPLIAPDGMVFAGTMGGNGYRGQLNQFNSNLTTAYASGGFGWDNTPTILPVTAVPQYRGFAKYLLLTKYNYYGWNGKPDYAAILDPTQTQFDPYSNAMVMKEIALMPSPKGKEWCIMSAAYDAAHRSVYMNNEDGVLYKWDLAANQLTEEIRLSPGIGEAYTPTLIGPDGAVYAINMSVLSCVDGARDLGLPAPKVD